MRTNFGQLLIILVKPKYGFHGNVKKITMNQIWATLEKTIEIHMAFNLF